MAIFLFSPPRDFRKNRNYLPAGAGGSWGCFAVSGTGAGTVCSAAGIGCFSTMDELLWLAV